MMIKLNSHKFCKIAAIVAVSALFSCKPKKPQASDVKIGALLDNYKDFQEQEWIALKDTYLKSDPVAESSVNPNDTRKNCKIPAQAYLRLLVDGRKSSEQDGHIAVCAKEYNNKKPFEIRLRQGERMPPDQIDCDHRGLLQKHWKPWQFAYSENFGRVVRLKVKDKDANENPITTPAYLKRAPHPVEAIEPVCAKYYPLTAEEKSFLQRVQGSDLLTEPEKRRKLEERGIDPRGFNTNSCYCKLNPGDQISVYFGADWHEIRAKKDEYNDHAQIKFILDYTPANRVSEPKLHVGCNGYDINMKSEEELRTFRCLLGLHGSVPEGEVGILESFEDNYNWDSTDPFGTAKNQKRNNLRPFTGPPHLYAFVDPTKFSVVNLNVRSDFEHTGVTNTESELTLPDKDDYQVENLKDNVFHWPLKKGAESNANLFKHVTSVYGPRWGRMHYGLDIAGADGKTIIVASNLGKIDKVVKMHRVAGNYSHVNHLTRAAKENGTNTLVTRYLHQSDKKPLIFTTADGTMVSACDQIGWLGTTGGSTGPHLHFEYEKNGGSINPCPFVTEDNRCPKGQVVKKPNLCKTVGQAKAPQASSK